MNLDNKQKTLLIVFTVIIIILGVSGFVLTDNKDEKKQNFKIAIQPEKKEVFKIDEEKIKVLYQPQPKIIEKTAVNKPAIITPTPTIKGVKEEKISTNEVDSFLLLKNNLRNNQELINKKLLELLNNSNMEKVTPDNVLFVFEQNNNIINDTNYSLISNYKINDSDNKKYIKVIAYVDGDQVITNNSLLRLRVGATSSSILKVGQLIYCKIIFSTNRLGLIPLIEDDDNLYTISDVDNELGLSIRGLKIQKEVSGQAINAGTQLTAQALVGAAGQFISSSANSVINLLRQNDKIFINNNYKVFIKIKSKIK